MRFKKALCFALAFAALTAGFTGSGLLSPTPAAAKTVSQLESEKKAAKAKADEAKKKLEKLRQERADKQKILDALRAQQRALQNQIDLAQAEINALKKEIADAEALIEKTEKDLADSKELFAERIRALYVSGDSAGLEILLGSESFADYLMKAEMLAAVTKQDTKLMEELSKKIETVNKTKAAVTEKKKKQESAYRELAAKQAEIKKSYNEELQVQSQIESNINTTQRTIAEYERQQKLLQQEIDRLYREAQNSDIKFSGGFFAWPAQGSTYISSYYGSRWGSFHYGLDISGSRFLGRPILAAADGYVAKVNTNPYNGTGYGLYLIINHGQKDGVNYMTLYAHCSRLAVSAGQYVKRGQVIAYAGSTGNSTGPHLHFEVHVNGKRVNPLPYLK